MRFLKHYAIQGILAVLISGCGSVEEKEEHHLANEMSENVSSAEEASSVSEAFVYDPSSFQEIHEIPALEFKGILLGAWKWEDMKGTHYLIHSKKETDPETYPISAYLYSYHYAQNGNGFELFRLVQDYVEQCDFDITCDFAQAPTVTDLDANGQTEVTVCYKLSCRSDVSSNEMKVIMHDENGKYGLRGYDYVIFRGEEDPREGFNANRDAMNPSDEWEFFMGRYENDTDFNHAPPAFLKHADSIWLTNAFIFI